MLDSLYKRRSSRSLSAKLPLSLVDLRDRPEQTACGEKKPHLILGKRLCQRITGVCQEETIGGMSRIPAGRRCRARDTPRFWRGDLEGAAREYDRSDLALRADTADGSAVQPDLERSGIACQEPRILAYTELLRRRGVQRSDKDGFAV